MQMRHKLIPAARIAVISLYRECCVNAMSSDNNSETGNTRVKYPSDATAAYSIDSKKCNLASCIFPASVNTVEKMTND